MSKNKLTTDLLGVATNINPLQNVFSIRLTESEELGHQLEECG